MANHRPILSSTLRSPVRMLAIILVLVFTTEVVVMLVLPYLLPGGLGEGGEAFLDGTLLTLVIAPVLWVVIRSARRAEDERISMAREQEALRSQQMATLAQLATGVAHEIRNPLTSIKMMIQVNRLRFAEKGLPTDDLEIVEHEIRRMERSVNSLLEYARPEESAFGELTLQKVIASTELLVEGRCQSQRVHFELQVPSAAILVHGDGGQIQQLLLNLILNGLDAMPGGGTLTVELLEDQGLAKIRVLDTGRGISAGLEDRLFEPFVTTKQNGVGLGLGICRRIAESHRGTLVGFNRETQGAEFCLQLPLLRVGSGIAPSHAGDPDLNTPVGLTE